mmetsp:Transcript_147319/g.473321  ORF Transcript_147319/g.473321 Transcript_147319/m.473321 type:complete len:208 (-) Transcript_147319:585-1208(-)
MKHVLSSQLRVEDVTRMPLEGRFRSGNWLILGSPGQASLVQEVRARELQRGGHRGRRERILLGPSALRVPRHHCVPVPRQGATGGADSTPTRGVPARHVAQGAALAAGQDPEGGGDGATAASAAGGGPGRGAALGSPAARGAVEHLSPDLGIRQPRLTHAHEREASRGGGQRQRHGQPREPALGPVTGDSGQGNILLCGPPRPTQHP